MFKVAPEVRDTASWIIVAYALLAFTRLIPYITMVGIFRAGGDTKTGTIIDVGCLWIFGLPITALCIIHFVKYKWIKPLTEAKT